jgi:hypothetical protein
MLSQKYPTEKGAGGVAQVVKQLSSKSLSLNPSPAKTPTLQKSAHNTKISSLSPSPSGKNTAPTNSKIIMGGTAIIKAIPFA